MAALTRVNTLKLMLNSTATFRPIDVVRAPKPKEDVRVSIDPEAYVEVMSTPEEENA